MALYLFGGVDPHQYVEDEVVEDQLLVVNTASNTQDDFFLVGKDETKLVKVTYTGSKYNPIKTVEKYEHTEVFVEESDKTMQTMLEESMD